MKIWFLWVFVFLKLNDFDKFFYVFFYGVNFNDFKLFKFALVYYNKWGIVRKNYEMVLSKFYDFDLGFGFVYRKEGYRFMIVGIIIKTFD